MTDSAEKSEEEDEPDLQEEMQEELNEEVLGQPVSQWVDEGAFRKEPSSIRKAEARGQAERVAPSDLDEEPRSKRQNKGIPPMKYLMDLIG